MVNHERSHQFLVVKQLDGKWRWTWLLPLQVGAVVVQGMCSYKSRAGALRSAYVQTDKLQQMILELNRGDMV
jgi:uncharacterized protein YegP (UPF0339 family)